MGKSHDLNADLFAVAADSESAMEYWNSVLQILSAAWQSEFVSASTATDGQWHTIACTTSAGDSPKPPPDVLGEAADTGQIAVSENWTALSISPRTGPIPSPIVLATLDGDTDHSTWETTSKTLNAATRIVMDRLNAVRRANRLQAILNISSGWNQTSQISELLTDVANAAASFMEAERATIFLWDRTTKTLVGRPALGIDDQELRIPDDTGIVGQVIRDGIPRRATKQSNQHDTIAKEIDAQLSFETRNLVCVPMTNRAGKTIGAFQLINKLENHFDQDDETDLQEFAAQAAVAIETCQDFQQLLISQITSPLPTSKTQLIGDSQEMAEVRTKVERVARSDLTVLLLGENGTGKDVASRMIHEQSPRKGKTYLAINCAAISSSLIESELFGHEKGAFTDANQSRAGKFEAASGGTLFLDEIGELPITAQAKLLRALEEKTVVRVGGMEPIPADVRIVAATNQDLPQMVRERKFREDLFFRMNVVTIIMPPLRERRDDIEKLATHFLSEFCTAANRSIPSFSTKAAELLRTHDWPGNVRELRNLMERIAYLTNDSIIDTDALMLSSETIEANVAENLPLAEATRQFQISYIQRQIELAAGNMTEAAKRLGLHRSNLYRKMSQLGLSTDDS